MCATAGLSMGTSSIFSALVAQAISFDRAAKEADTDALAGKGEAASRRMGVAIERLFAVEAVMESLPVSSPSEALVMLSLVARELEIRGEDEDSPLWRPLLRLREYLLRNATDAAAVTYASSNFPPYALRLADA